MTLENYRPKPNYLSLFTLFVVALLMANVSCKRAADKSANANASNTNSSVAADETSSTPPFSTKEPERYQAIWVTSAVAGPGTESIPGMSALANQQMPVARDGAKRRVETEMLPGVKIIYLQLANGRYALYPPKKIYSEIKMDGSDNPLGLATGTPSDFTPDKLISGAMAGSKYEKLGTETINGRMTTKYRVTSAGGDSSKQTSETIIWADESLGMPIKSESTSTNGSKFTWEMRDIKLEVDASLFELPKNYRKVEHSELISSALPSVNEALPSVKDVLGIGDEKKTTRKR